MCAVLEMEREKAVEEERMQNELRQRKKMEKESGWIISEIVEQKRSKFSERKGKRTRM